MQGGVWHRHRRVWAASRDTCESSAWTPGSVIALPPSSDPERGHPWADVVIPTGLDHLRNALVARPVSEIDRR